MYGRAPTSPMLHPTSGTLHAGRRDGAEVGEGEAVQVQVSLRRRSDRSIEEGQGLFLTEARDHAMLTSSISIRAASVSASSP